MARINPDFKNELHTYGAVDLNACYNCGNCTAVCSLSTEENSFPREMVRYSVLGAESKITSSLKPWLCYYCGECSDTCPQEADPGTLMMGLRRYLTAAYDWTGLSGLLYKSLPLSLLALILTASLVILFGFSKNFDQQIIMHQGHLFEIFAIAGVFAIILMPNIIHMWYLTMVKPGYKIPFLGYLKGISNLFIHMFTQKRTLDCDDSQIRWFEHLVLVIAYLSLLFTTVVLNWFSSESKFIIVLGYIESGLIFILTFDFVLSRIRKKKQISKHSQPSDWFFVIWLFLLGISSFIVRLFIDLQIIENNVWVYMVHLIVLVQWALIIVPFGKWTHFLYRSFAIYFERIRSFKI
jgi:quinone-modifying oxidoreductase subunit QmoC